MKKRRKSKPTSGGSLDARRRVTVYLLSVIEDPKAETSRRDEMALCLAKIEASARNPTGPKGAPKPRVSTYVSKKKQAEAASKTAHKGSPWNGLINGSRPADIEQHDE